jgi:hypothetical protein
MDKRDSLRALREATTELHWAASVYKRMSAEQRPLDQAFRTLMDALTAAFSAIRNLPRDEFTEKLRRVCREMEAEGAHDAWTNYPDLSDGVVRSASRIVEEIDKELSEVDFQAESIKAQQAGLFVDWVQRNIGKGAIKKYARIHDFYGPGVDVFVYPNDKWVQVEIFEGPQVEDCFDRVSEISAPKAAVMILASEQSLSVDELKYLKALAATAEPDGDPAKTDINWDRDRGELRVDGHLARRVTRLNQAKNVVKVLDTFQELGWPEHIDSPFPPSEDDKLRETIRSLNSNANRVEFEADGTGEGIRYKLIEQHDETAVAPDSNGDLPF